MKKRGQVWVETVLYTLIAITLMGVALAFIMPRINAAKDTAAVDQAIGSLNTIDEKINSALEATGSVRIMEVTIKRGELNIDPVGDKITLVISDLSKPYSEPGIEISQGAVKILSTKGPKYSTATLTLNYAGIVDLKYKNSDSPGRFSQSATPYSVSAENLGNPSGMSVINIDSVSGR